METGIKSSFIPHEVSGGGGTLRISQGGAGDLLALASTVMFVASIALAVGVFLYGQFLSVEVNSKLEQLERAKAAFEPALIDELARIDDRMHSASEILSQHVAPSALFKAIEDSTLKSVYFQNLAFEASDPKLMELKMRGVANSMNAIALQADLFNKSGVIKNPIFSNISRSETGVRFEVAAQLDPNPIYYEQILNALSASAEGLDEIEQSSPFVPREEN